MSSLLEGRLHAALVLGGDEVTFVVDQDKVLPVS